ncbi:hypothetical protein ACFUCV_07935 [Specibacter sp. NPDC057265]|uniref:hypothetical protein n=1 Tax=Specibacter sp. NPDC057265 TaxID=3346075 RepID=UPI003640A382
MLPKDAPPTRQTAPAPDHGPAPRRPAALAAAACSGVGAGLLGTSLHGHLWFPAPGTPALPVGALLALLLMAAVSFFVSLWSRNAWMGVWCGAAAYLTAGLLSLQLDGSGLIFANMQGQLWLYGIALCALLVPLLARRVLGPRKQRPAQVKRPPV